MICGERTWLGGPEAGDPTMEPAQLPNLVRLHFGTFQLLTGGWLPRRLWESVPYGRAAESSWLV